LQALSGKKVRGGFTAYVPNEVIMYCQIIKN